MKAEYFIHQIPIFAQKKQLDFSSCSAWIDSVLQSELWTLTLVNHNRYMSCITLKLPLSSSLPLTQMASPYQFCILKFSQILTRSNLNEIEWFLYTLFMAVLAWSSSHNLPTAWSAAHFDGETVDFLYVWEIRLTGPLSGKLSGIHMQSAPRPPPPDH